ncbi:related to TOM5 - mitochondrial outer membrane protein [Ustilago sp. UG-2017a]|nr:related to TOM5 - mitochondrial outer membrane protein [Ustilago sp. UG-2017a]
MFGGAPRQPSPAEAAVARLQARNTLKQFAVYAAGLWTAPIALYYLNELLGRHIA